MPGQRFDQGIYYDNLGMSYSAGTFTVHGADGRALSSSNPAVVVLPSKASPGQFTRYNITANQSFIDDAGSSDIIGNLFGLTTGIAYAEDLPFFLYVVGNDAETAIQLMIARIPHVTRSPVAANIGAPDDAVANSDQTFWSFDNIDETLYDQNPCLCVGSFRMQMSSSDDWTVQTLSNQFDGIGLFQEGQIFTTVAGHFGAASGKFWKDNGGTAPSFSSNLPIYTLTKDGYVKFSGQFVTAVAGVGNVNALVALPLTVISGESNMGILRYFDSSATEYFVGTASPNGAAVVPGISTAPNALRNANIDTSDQIVFNTFYLAAIP